jgi:hypothetical protein
VASTFQCYFFVERPCAFSMQGLTNSTNVTRHEARRSSTVNGQRSTFNSGAVFFCKVQKLSLCGRSNANFLIFPLPVKLHRPHFTTILRGRLGKLDFGSALYLNATKMRRTSNEREGALSPPSRACLNLLREMKLCSSYRDDAAVGALKSDKEKRPFCFDSTTYGHLVKRNPLAL